MQNLFLFYCYIESAFKKIQKGGRKLQKKNKKSLSEKEKLFCSFYVSCGNPYEAAVKSGYAIKPSSAAERLLRRDDILQEITKVSNLRQRAAKNCALCGYERLAFGSVSDAVKLLFIEKPLDYDIDKMDLFNVSEIRRPKDGSMEIKFFDRLRALEKLEELCGNEDNKTKPFYQALQQSTLAVNKVFGEDD